MCIRDRDHRYCPWGRSDDRGKLVANAQGHVPPSLAPGVNPALCPFGCIELQFLLGVDWHRPERVADEIRGSLEHGEPFSIRGQIHGSSVRGERSPCLLYTSDAADDLLCVDLGG